MAGALGAIAGAGISSGLSYLNSKLLQEDAQRFATSFDKQRYQRQMEDMRTAGLNPILSYRTGAPGAGGAGIAGQGTAAAAGISAAAQTSQAASAKGVRGNQENVLKAQETLFKQQTVTSAAEALKAGRQGGKFLEESREAQLRGDAIMEGLPKKRLQSRFYRHPDKGKAAVWAQEVGHSAKSIWSPFMAPRR